MSLFFNWILYFESHKTIVDIKVFFFGKFNIAFSYLYSNYSLLMWIQIDLQYQIFGLGVNFLNKLVKNDEKPIKIYGYEMKEIIQMK